jgi:hypothetical protein
MRLRWHEDDLLAEWLSWRPTPVFREPDDRWTGYHDPVTGSRLPYTKPIEVRGHYHPEALGGFDSRCGHCVYLRSLGNRER